MARATIQIFIFCAVALNFISPSYATNLGGMGMPFWGAFNREDATKFWKLDDAKPVTQEEHSAALKEFSERNSEIRRDRDAVFVRLQVVQANLSESQYELSQRKADLLVAKDDQTKAALQVSINAFEKTIADLKQQQESLSAGNQRLKRQAQEQLQKSMPHNRPLVLTEVQVKELEKIKVSCGSGQKMYAKSASLNQSIICLDDKNQIVKKFDLLAGFHGYKNALIMGSTELKWEDQKLAGYSIFDDKGKQTQELVFTDTTTTVRQYGQTGRNERKIVSETTFHNEALKDAQEWVKDSGNMRRGGMGTLGGLPGGGTNYGNYADNLMYGHGYKDHFGSMAGFAYDQLNRSTNARPRRGHSESEDEQGSR